MSSNGIYVWDIKDGVPDTVAAAYRFVSNLDQTPETQPNPKMAAFGQKMGIFIKEALAHFDGDYALENIRNIASSTSHTLERVYCFDASPDADLLARVFTCAIIRAASENGLAVLQNDWEMLFLPDGTDLNTAGEKSDWRAYVAGKEQEWQDYLVQRKAEKNIPKIPKGEQARERFVCKIIQNRIGAQLEELFAKYHYDVSSFAVNMIMYLQTDILDNFYTGMAVENSRGNTVFYAFIGLCFSEKYAHLAHKIPCPNRDAADTYKMGNRTRTIRFWDFYGIDPEESSSMIQEGLYDFRWKLESTDYADAVRLVEAAADMLMYILPHIGTAEAFEQFMAEHDAGKTNFAQLVLPETNPSKKCLIDVLQ